MRGVSNQLTRRTYDSIIREGSYVLKEVSRKYYSYMCVTGLILISKTI